MEIIEKKVSDLIPYENNPRKNDNAVHAVANSIQEFGFKVPIVIDGDNVIVCGHTRLKAAEQLGLETVPCVMADDLTPEQVKAFRLADNKTGELAEWDFEKLDEELAKIKDIDMSQYGFEEFKKKDISEFIEESENGKGTKQPKEADPVTCPYCGTTFDINTMEIIRTPETVNADN